MRVVVSVDWGFTNPGVMQAWLLDHDSRMYLGREHYMSKRLIGWWVARAKEFQAEYKPEAFVCDPAEPIFIREFQVAGLTAIKAFNEISPGIQAVQERLRIAEDGKPRLYICRDALVERDQVLETAKLPCSTLEEIDGYIWPKANETRSVKEVPVDRNNHGCDAMRYAVAYADSLGLAPPRRSASASIPAPPPKPLPVGY